MFFRWDPLFDSIRSAQVITHVQLIVKDTPIYASTHEKPSVFRSYNKLTLSMLAHSADQLHKIYIEKAG